MSRQPQRRGQPITVTLEHEAYGILRQYAPPRHRNMGAFLSRVIFEFRTRNEERAKLRQKQQIQEAESVT